MWLKQFLIVFHVHEQEFTICRYGQDFVSQSAPKYYKKVKNAQEAHEAIRPTDIRKLPCIMTQASFVNILLEWCAKGDF